MQYRNFPSDITKRCYLLWQHSQKYIQKKSHIMSRVASISGAGKGLHKTFKERRKFILHRNFYCVEISGLWLIKYTLKAEMLVNDYRR